MDNKHLLDLIREASLHGRPLILNEVSLSQDNEKYLEEKGYNVTHYGSTRIIEKQGENTEETPKQIE